MRYYILMRQAGQGCDYTIGCGYRWDAIEAETVEQATAEAIQKVQDRGWRHDGVEQAVLVSGAIDLAPLLDAERDREKAQAAQAQKNAAEAAQRAEYERLQKIYGGG